MYGFQSLLVKPVGQWIDPFEELVSMYTYMFVCIVSVTSQCDNSAPLNMRRVYNKPISDSNGISVCFEKHVKIFVWCSSCIPKVSRNMQCCIVFAISVSSHEGQCDLAPHNGNFSPIPLLVTSLPALMSMAHMALGDFGLCSPVLYMIKSVTVSEETAT